MSGRTPYRIRSELAIPVSVEEAFRFFENPYNLAKITPPWLRFRVLREGLVMKAGLEIDYKIRWMGLPLRWKTLITEYEPPYLFVDEQASGPYTLWRHRHEFRATPEGTLVSDEIEYVLPFGALGRVTHRLLVRKQLEGILEYRSRTLPYGVLSESSARRNCQSGSS